MVFVPTLRKLKRQGLHQYGTLATTYVGAFHKKWVKHDNPEQEAILGTGDIQSLADLGNSYAGVEQMRPLPIDLRALLHLLIAALLPVAFLLLTVMPLKDIIKLLLKVLV